MTRTVPAPLRRATEVAWRGTSPDAGGEAEITVIGERDGFLVGAEGHDGKNGAEGFLAHQAHGAVNVGDERGCVEVWAEVRERFAAGVDGGSKAAGFLDLAGDDLELLEADERAEIGIGKRAVADFELGDFLQAEAEEARIDAAVDVTALNRDTGLSGVHHGTPDGGTGGGVNVGIVEDDHGVFAAEFEGDGEQALGGGDGDTASGGDAAGENQLIDLAGDQRLAGGSESGDDLEGTRQVSRGPRQRAPRR